MKERFAVFILKNRLIILSIIIIVTIFFGRQMQKTKICTIFGDLLPQKHSYIVEIHNKFKDTFGGANQVLVEVAVKKGDIFNKDTLGKISRITEEVTFFPGVDRYKVFSIASRKAKVIKATAWGLEMVPLMWPHIPQTEEAMNELKANVYSDDRYFGKLVSRDSRAAVIISEFFEEELDYLEIFRKFCKIREREEDSNTEINIVGEPIIYGNVHENFKNTVIIFLTTICIMLGLLLYYFRNVLSMVIPIIAGTFSCIWGMGFASFLGYNFDPLILVIPFLITARAVSHSVQMVERFHEEYDISGDTSAASVISLREMGPPGLLAIFTDALGIIIIFLIPIPLMQKLAVTCSWWAMSVVFNALILQPILLWYLAPLTPHKKVSEMGGEFLVKALKKFAKLSTGRGHWLVVGVTLGLIVILGLVTSKRLVVGDLYPGSALLWPDSRFNRDSAKINSDFPGLANPLLVVVKGSNMDACKTANVLNKVDEFQRFLAETPEVTGTITIVNLLKMVNSVFHEYDPKWGMLPPDKESVGGLAFLLEGGGSEPGDYDSYVSYDYQNASVTAYCLDHKGETIKKVIENVKKFIKEKTPGLEGVEFKLGGGIMGVLAASNEAVAKYSQYIRVLIFIICFLCIAITYRSPVAGIIIIIPVALSDFLSVAYMAIKGIGLNINTLPVCSVGVGVGLDYGVYVLSRIQDEYKKYQDLETSILVGLSTSGKAVLFTGTTLIGGIIFWYLMSNLRFQAEMAFLISFLMFFNMLGAVIVVPSLISIIKPKFITG